MSKLDSLKRNLQQKRDGLGRWAKTGDAGSLGIPTKLRRKRLRDPDFKLGAVMSRGAIALKALETSLESAKTPAQKDAVFKKLRSGLVENSGVSRAEAKKQVGAIVFDKSVDKEKKWQARKIITDTATDFYQLTGGGGGSESGKLKSFKLTEGRAYACRESNYVNIGYYTTKEVVMHEMGHFLEFQNSNIKAAAIDWRNSQADSKAPKKLSKITGNSSFSDDEIAMRDKYLSPYVGKVYSDNYTEVVAMGVERFADHTSMKKFHEIAPSHFQFILGILTKPKKND